MSKVLNLYKIKELFLFLLLFLACFNFLGRGPVFFFVFCLYGLFITRSVRWNNTCLTYLCMTIAALLASLVYYESKEAIKSLVYFLSFYIGYRFYNTSKENNYSIKKLIFWGAAGFVAYLIFVAYLNIIILGHEQGGRLMINPWNNEETSATIFGLLSSVPIAYSFYCIFCQRSSWLKAVGFLYLALSIWINYESATRTPFVIFAVIYAFLMLELFRAGTIKSRFSLVGFIVILLIMFIYFFMHTAQDSVIAERFEDRGFKSLRWDYSKIYFENMWTYPWGGGFVEKQYHIMAHNFVQESYDYYGIFFFIPLLFALFGMMKRMIKLHTIKVKSNLVYLFLSLYIGVLIQIMMEPVIVGFPQLIWFLFMIDGILVGALHNSNDSCFNGYSPEINKR